MPRPRRPDIAAVPQHVIQRGNDRQPCFFTDADRQRYLAALREAALRYGCQVHAYVLMTNHVHLLVTPDNVGAVSRMMHTLGSTYVGYFNVAHQRTGTLWEGRYRSCLVDSETYLLTCHRYIELNPVRAGMVVHPAEYRWSSYRCNAADVADRLVTPHPVYSALGTTSAKRCAAYADIVRQALTDDEIESIRTYVQQQRALGTPHFQATIEAQLGRCVHVRPARRPRAAELAIKRV